MSDRRLKVFHAVAKLLSFTKAAESLHMTQPAVTFQVRQLEEYFNTRLFDRTHNKVNLTPAGNKVYEFADRIFDLYDEMENSVRELTGEISGALTIGASTTIAEYMLPTLLGQFKAKYPEINIRLKVSNTEGIVSMVEHNVIDLGVVEASVSNKNLIVEMCHDDQLVVVAPPSHELSKQSFPVKPEQLKALPFICREEGSGTREVILEYLQDNDISHTEMNFCLELGSPEALKGAVEAGMGISILSRSTIAKELKLGTLSEIQLDPPLSRPFSFVRQRQKFRVRVMEELLEFAKAYCKSDAE
ncbi:MAG: LysR family transcriptional regulator [Gammaproteobacteria bacterium]|jgi:DNA-binding transcriptional LysR family regulator|nr:LysR family transcriptional regulator [Gammaproteobacteria bacterium]MBT3723332.1 LysR family transcriptional regulator [Gammaproteobacteria bacterium]MBT4078779.1 LysR family transcriptional regulator [Gammaproteobacteria bacterium]MBT4194525.1 LysR family transcriptional regulator [Gammaproteobacteria bacterium]MBT4449762.1 LysR family transcriptional regulator [Gammaproteobacteria bacterium]